MTTNVNVHCGEALRAECVAATHSQAICIYPEGGISDDVRLFVNTSDQCAILVEALHDAENALAAREHDDHLAHDDREANLTCTYCWPSLTPAQRRAQAQVTR